MKFEIPKIYPITDTFLSGLTHPEQVKKLIAGGATLVQLREKHASPKDFYESAADAVKIAKDHGVGIIINDRVDIALSLNADGVHLGQDDMPPKAARAILGNDAIIGFSTHSVEQAIAASRLPVDYIAIGPVFATQTKKKPDAVVGLNGLREVREAIGELPLIAIGGINAGNVLSLFDAGSDSVAIIGAILSEQDIDEQMRLFIDLSNLAS